MLENERNKDRYYALAAIFAKPPREDIPFEKITALLRGVGAHIEPDEDQGCWLIAIAIDKSAPRVLITPRHRGYASRELVEELKAIFEALGITP